MSNKFKLKKDRQFLPKPPLVTKRLWHYTAYQHLQKIIASGKIRVSSIRIDKRERPAAWFSSNPDFEQTAKKGVENSETGIVRHALGRDELLKAGFPPVRIEIDPSRVQVYDWEQYKKVSGISKKAAVDLEEAGINMGAAPSEWYASFQSVPLESCLLPIEIWNGQQWVNIREVNIEATEPQEG